MQSNLSEGDSTLLLAIVEVEQSDRVMCQAEGCGHPVFKRIHVVRIAGSIKVFGSACFERLFSSRGKTFSVPAFGSSDGRRLTAEEKLLLLQNTEALIFSLEKEHAHQVLLAQEKEQERIAALEQLQRKRFAPDGSKHSSRSTSLLRSYYNPGRIVYAGDKWEAAVRAAKLKMQSENPGVDLDAPGFNGLILIEARKLFREM